MKKTYLIVLVMSLLAGSVLAENFTLKSPDGKTRIEIQTGEHLNYAVWFNENQILQPSGISFRFSQSPPLGNELSVLSENTKSIDESWKPVLKRYDLIRNYYNELTLELQEDNFPKRKMNLVFRAYNTGAAFRTEFPKQFGEKSFVLTDELTQFKFYKDYTCWAVNYGSYTTSQEMEFAKRKISDIQTDMVIGLPMTVQINDNCYAAITEAALTDYAGMYLKPGNTKDGLCLRSALAPRKGQPEKGEKVYFKTPHQTPWRVIMLGEQPGDLVESEIVQNLNEPCAIEDPSWILPGISAWDHWWSGEVKLEQDVIYEYIDLASKMGWPYMLIDWQWYGPYNEENADIKTPAKQLNMQEIRDYAKSKNVKLWLWMYNTDVFRFDFEEACALYQDWGIAGIKIDFMDSDDQETVNWYHKVVTTAAKYHLMVDFHGAYKPTGWRRTYPNLVTREGVMGNEYNKWSLNVTPEHLCTLPFTRMLAGPMDFTPGGFLNNNPDKFLNASPAQVLGTRSCTLAEFVIFDSPYTVACDHPDHYYGQVGEDFLKQVHSTWDDTKVLNGRIGEYITMARRNGENWFLGAMTNSKEREVVISLDFLPEGKYKMTTYSDSDKTKQDAKIAVKNEITVSKGDSYTIRMVEGGGFAAVIEPLK